MRCPGSSPWLQSALLERRIIATSELIKEAVIQGCAEKEELVSALLQSALDDAREFKSVAHPDQPAAKKMLLRQLGLELVARGPRLSPGLRELEVSFVFLGSSLTSPKDTVERLHFVDSLHEFYFGSPPKP
jgi:hypothetical protein